MPLCWRAELKGKQKEESFFLKERPCVRIHQHPTSLYALLYSPCTSNQNVWKHCAGLLPASEEFQPLLLLTGHHSKTTQMSILFGCVVKHVWEYRTPPIHLCIWPKFWLTTAGLDQWLVVKLPLLMINIRTEGEQIHYSVACGWKRLLWNELKTNHSISNSKSLMTFRVTPVFLRCVSCCRANLFRAEEKIFQRHTTEKALVPERCRRAHLGVLKWASRCLFPQIRKSLQQVWGDVELNRHPPSPHHLAK